MPFFGTNITIVKYTIILLTYYLSPFDRTTEVLESGDLKIFLIVNIVN